MLLFWPGFKIMTLMAKNTAVILITVMVLTFWSQTSTSQRYAFAYGWGTRFHCNTQKVVNEGKSFNCETLIMDSFLNISSFQMQQFTVTLTTPISQRKLWLWCLGQWQWKGGWCCNKKKGKESNNLPDLWSWSIVTHWSLSWEIEWEPFGISVSLVTDKEFFWFWEKLKLPSS